MTQRTLIAELKISWKHISVALLVLLYIVINIFRIGGDQFISYLNDNLILPLTLGVAVLAIMIWRRVIVQSKNRLLWYGLAIGWAIWTIAELWWAIASDIGTEVPYPSWADFFWLLGYLPMYVALWGRIRSLPRNRNRLQRAGIWISILLSTGWTILFVLIPIIQNNDPATLLMSVLNVLYPLVDLILLIMVLQILFAYQQGIYGRAWGWLSAGFVFHSISNLIFSYATTFDLYYPNGQANFLSTLAIDIPYNLSYLLWLIGLLMVWNIQISHHAFKDVYPNVGLVPNTHILVSTKGDDTVIEVSQNYWRVFPQRVPRGETILETIGISPSDAISIIGDLKANHLLRERALLVNTSLGQQQAWVSGVTIKNPQGEYAGVTLLLRMLMDSYDLDELLTDYQRGLVDSLLRKTGSKEKEEEEIKQLLSNYYRSYLMSFYNRIYSEGGSIMTEAFITDLQASARQHEWQIEIHPDLLLDVSALSLATTRQALLVLYETAKRFVAKTIDENVVNTIVQRIRSQLDENILKNINYFETNML